MRRGQRFSNGINSKLLIGFRGKLIANASNGVFNLADGRRFSLQAMKMEKLCYLCMTVLVGSQKQGIRYRV